MIKQIPVTSLIKRLTVRQVKSFRIPRNYVLPSYKRLHRRTNFKRFLKKIVASALVILCYIGVMGYSFPAQASTLDDPDFETKVLQIVRDHPEVIVDSLNRYQQQQQLQLQKRQEAFLQQMKADPQLMIADSPTKGSSAHDIVMLVFSDFQCPYCGQVYQTLNQFVDRHDDRVTLVYKHLPLVGIHPQALSAATAAWAAAQQGKFWEYHDALFTNQEQLGEPLYSEIAKSLNLDLQTFERDRHSETAITSIQNDVNMARNFAVMGTPFIAINGRAISGAVDLAELEKVLTEVINDEA